MSYTTYTADNRGRGREQISLDEYDERSLEQAYGRARSTPGASDAMPGIKPAHPLSARPTGRINYDRYLEQSKDKFHIFSAAERRRRNRSIMGAAALGVFVLLTVIAIILLLCGVI